ncbi:hypothetical protein CYLTODRAFT_416353 [Cylindrobasidium torrendii FP15055 ss-10]|uniref:Uncharacterized protein n=1 Tax=Cylindrobasidium torrendii FP15055 ss-10 TaxID=1314674 RepID=A0A0D7BV07_9AGAR|nr:hypothetical protein CYLTODRAFT_416353 [Cylindrobasidium torrendii FP15055 ss-10]
MYRSETPPPRAESPELPYIPLEPPRRRLRPSGHSCESLRPTRRTALNKSASRASLKPGEQFPLMCSYASSPPTSPRSLPLSSPPRSPPTMRPRRRSLSCAVPHRSPPASPLVGDAPPPVPPLPEFVLTPVPSADTKAPSIDSVVVPIELPELDPQSPVASTLKNRRSKSSRILGLFKSRTPDAHQTPRAMAVPAM